MNSRNPINAIRSFYILLTILAIAFYSVYLILLATHEFINNIIIYLTPYIIIVVMSIWVTIIQGRGFLKSLLLYSFLVLDILLIYLLTISQSLLEDNYGLFFFYGSAPIISIILKLYYVLQ